MLERRELIVGVHEILSRSDATVETLVNNLGNYLDTIDTGGSSKAKWGNEIIADMKERLGKIKSGEIDAKPISTGFQSIDAMANGGFGRGHVDIIAAKTNVGKSMLAANIAANAVREGHKVLIANFEMDLADYMARLLGSMYGIDTGTWKGHGGFPDEGIMRQIETDRAQEMFSRVLIGTPEDFETVSALRAAQMVHDFGFILVDYTQCMKSAASERETQTNQIKRLIIDLGKLAVAGNCSVVGLAQVKQDIDYKQHVPTEYDVMESAWFAKKCDRLWILAEWKDETQRLALVKNRHGKKNLYTELVTEFERATYIDVDPGESLPLGTWKGGIDDK